MGGRPRLWIIPFPMNHCSVVSLQSNTLCITLGADPNNHPLLVSHFSPPGPDLFITIPSLLEGLWEVREPHSNVLVLKMYCEFLEQGILMLIRGNRDYYSTLSTSDNPESRSKEGSQSVMFGSSAYTYCGQTHNCQKLDSSACSEPLRGSSHH